MRPESSRFGIRYSLSLLLLTSALNLAIVAVAATYAAIRIPGSLVDVEAALLFPLAWSLLLAIVFIGVAFSLRRIVSRPLEELAATARELGRGTLDVDVPGRHRRDELGDLAAAMEGMRRSLADKIGQIREQGDRLATILETMDEGVMLVDRDLRLLVANRAVEGLLGRLAGQAGVRAGDRLDRSGVALLAEPPAAGETARAVELTLEPDHPRGSRRWRRIVRNPLRDPAGRPNGYVAVIQDTTSEREVERVKNDFLSMVTHELKTPLTVIQGYVRLLQKEQPGPLTEDQRRFLGMISSQSDVLLAMIQDLLDLSRIAAGRFGMEFRPVDARRLVREAVERFEPQASQKGISLTLDEPEGGEPAPALSGDPVRLGQVLANLIGNGLKFTPSGGRITVGWRIDSGRFVCLVADTGIGIPAEELERIFEPFHQVDRGDTRRGGGVGLGLHISRSIVTGHGGTITASSQGSGSVFRFVLPLGRDQSQPPPI